jgi:hypothetical protein
MVTVAGRMAHLERRRLHRALLRPLDLDGAVALAF